MKKVLKKSIKLITAIVIVLLFLFALFTVWFYKTPASAFKDTVALVIPYPAAMVGGRPIYLRDLLDRLQAGGDRGQALRQIINEQETKIIAERLGVSVGDRELDNQLASIKASDNNFQKTLRNYGMSESRFKNTVLKPELLYTNIKIWFNGQRSLNPNEYGTADYIVSQTLNSGSSTFTSLLKKYSQDEGLKGLDGDLGFVDINSLRPEFKEAFDQARLGDVKVAPGSDGIYIFYIQSKDNNGLNGSLRVHAREIFLRVENFDQWYNNETKNIIIKNLYGN